MGCGASRGAADGGAIINFETWDQFWNLRSDQRYQFWDLGSDQRYHFWGGELHVVRENARPDQSEGVRGELEQGELWE